MKQLKRNFVAAFMLVMALLSPGLHAANSYGIPDKIQDGNILHCFDWTFTDIQAMLPQIAQAGFGAVQVSPVQGNAATNAEWYFAYMPYDLKFKANGNGSRAQLQSLCSEAQKYGIKVVVDVVANHVNQASGYHDTWWDSNGRVRWNGGCDYGNRYSITHGQLGDYGDVNSEDTQVQQRAKAFVEDLKSLGVTGIRWDAAKHIGLPSEGCNFWSTVTSVSGMWHYGEILDGPGGDGNKLMKEYTNYMSVTDNSYSNDIRNSVCNGNVPSSYAGWASGTIAGDKVVYWGESHDDYSNEWKASTYISQDKIDRTWAIGACRAGAVGLYFSRPSATERNQIKLGQKGSTHFTSKEIAAINHLRNAAVGAADYYTASNGVACITRQGVGAAIIVGAGGSRQVTISNGGSYVPAGTYTDEVSGNKFTVTSSTISGQVGSTGIAVIYDAKAAKQPSVSFEPSATSFRAETLTVTATLVNATSGWYKIGSGSQKSFTGTTSFSIGAGVDYGQTITISWSATGSEGTTTGQVSYTKLDPNAVVYVYYNNPGNWGNVNAYIYSETSGEVAAWPGSPMSKQNDGLWHIEVPEAFIDGGMVIFNNGNDQYPAGNQPGLPINGNSMICRDNVTWTQYDGSTGGNQGGGNQGGGNDNPGQGGDTSASGYYVYLSNTYGWNAPTVHAWNDNENCTAKGSWPGDVMTNDGTYWKWTVPAGKIPTKIIFSNSGNNQTADLDYVNKATYDCSGAIIATPPAGGGDDPVTPDPVTNITIYWDNSSANWSTPYIHYWGGATESSWPGVAMTKVEGNIWKYEIPSNSTGILFNAGDGDNTKTNDFAVNANHVYKQNGDQGEYNGGNQGGGNQGGDDPQPPTPPTPGAGYTVYWDNSEANWNVPYIHYWGGASESEWPGVPMTKVEGNIWKYDVPAGTEQILFHPDDNPNYKTADLNATANHIYNFSGDKGEYTGGNQGGGNQGGGDEPQPTGTYVYFDNSDSNWSDVYCYAWEPANGDWPGVKMEKGKNNIWRYDLGSNNYAQVIFSNGSGTQTVDLTCTKGNVYKVNGEQDGKMTCSSSAFTGTWESENQGGGNQGGDTPTPGEGFTIYWDNSTANWATPYVHYFGGSSESSWPGVAMTKVEGNIWSYNVPAGTTGLVFNAGDGDNTKTGDMVAVANHVYKQDGDKGEYNNGGGNQGGDDPNPGDDPVTPQPVPEGTYNITDYYKVNPNGNVGTNKTINVTVNNMKSANALSNWTPNELIAQGVARDICQAFKGVHERPVVDNYALYAAYDSQNLYLGVQYVYTVWDEYGEGFQAGESKPYNMDGDLMIVFDLDPSKNWDGTLTNGNSVWKDKAYTTFNNGMDCMWHGSTKPGVGTPGIFFPNASGKADYNDPASCKTSHVTYGYADGVLPSITAIYGQKDFGYDPSALEGNTGFVDLKSEVARLGGNDSAHTFYEFKFPLSDLGITENYIKQQGIGVMIVDMYGASAHSTLPYDPSMFDNVNEAYSQDPSSSKEKEDLDVVTYGFARIGKLADSSASMNGDVNGDGELNVSDVTAVVNAIINGGAGAADANGDGVVNVSDITYIVNLLLSE